MPADDFPDDCQKQTGAVRTCDSVHLSTLSPGALNCLIQLCSALIQLGAGMLDAFVMLDAVMLDAGMLGFMMLDS